MKKIIFSLTLMIIFSCSNLEKTKELQKYVIKESNYNILCEQVQLLTQNKYKHYLSYNECINSVEYSFKTEESNKRKIADHIGMYYVTIVPEFGWAQCEVLSKKDDKPDNKHYETYDECTKSDEFKYYESN